MRKLTNQEWHEIIEFLQNAEAGQYVEYNEKTVVVDDMEGGRFLCYDMDHEFVRLVETAVEAMSFLKHYDES